MRSTYFPSIILIDDDEDDRQMLSSALQLHGCSVRTFDAGDRAIEALKLLKHAQDVPSLIILDYNMPGMNGEEVLRILKEEQLIKDVPVIVYSTGLSSLFEKALLNRGAYRGMVKSWSYKEFTEQVLEFKAIACSQQRPVKRITIKTSFKFFTKPTSSKRANRLLN
jgi:CheY-like chemotaxis protein